MDRQNLGRSVRLRARGFLSMRGAAARTAAVILCLTLLGTGAGAPERPPPMGGLCGLVISSLNHRRTALRLRGGAGAPEEINGRRPLVDEWTSSGSDDAIVEKPRWDINNNVDAMYMRRYGMLDDPVRGEGPWDSEAERVLGALRGKLDRCGTAHVVLIPERHGRIRTRSLAWAALDCRI